MALSELKKVKRKNASKGENLSKVSKDEVLDHLPSYFQDRSLGAYWTNTGSKFGYGWASTNGTLGLDFVTTRKGSLHYVLTREEDQFCMDLFRYAKVGH